MVGQNFALGMIETIGFPALVAAADAAAKAADVHIASYQGVDAGIVTVYIIGDVASVQAAVQVGEAEARRVGQLRYSHVIARPDSSVPKMILELFQQKQSEQQSKKKNEQEQINRRKPQDPLSKSTSEGELAQTVQTAAINGIGKAEAKVDQPESEIQRKKGEERT